ncbi:hypothetical protein GLOIN_2v1839916 [Rhizophagus irregularis DAOM 181602=DAOM 197198]|nr:hypothetical protein GLOIN_2v1839916 [Rhizophagus irregularis DAOM 181602=DAOM 197198]
MWDENPVTPVTSWDNVETVSGQSTEKDAQSSTIIENSNTKKKKNKKKKIASFGRFLQKISSTVTLSITVILNYRSYLRRILSTNKKKNNGTLVYLWRRTIFEKL